MGSLLKLNFLCVLCVMLGQASQNDAVFSLHGGASQKPDGQDQGNPFLYTLIKILCV